jgi:hypothetical protein
VVVIARAAFACVAQDQGGQPAADIKVSIYKAHPFLNYMDDVEEPTIVECWDKLPHFLGKFESEAFLQMYKSQVFLAMFAMRDAETPTSKELLVVRRDKALEVWTKVPYKKNKLIMLPSTSEVKERYWTLGRSALVLGTEKLSKSKHLALDGRLNKAPNKDTKADEQKPFNVFWAVERTTDKKLANLTMRHLDVEMSVSVSSAGTGLKRKFGQIDTDSCQLPFYANPEDIKANTRLIAMDDTSLLKIVKSHVK